MPEATDGTRNLSSWCSFATTEGAVRLLRSRLSVAADVALLAVGRLGALTAFVKLPSEDATRLLSVVQALQGSALGGGRLLGLGVMDGDVLARFLRMSEHEQHQALSPNDASPAAQERTAALVSLARQALQRVY